MGDLCPTARGRVRPIARPLGGGASGRLVESAYGGGGVELAGRALRAIALERLGSSSFRGRPSVLGAELVPSWWLHAAPLDVELAVCVVEEKGQVIGLGPFCISQRAGVRIVRPLAYGAGVGIEPLCTPDENGGGAPIATALAGASGATIVELPGVPLQSPWPGVLAEGMGGAVLSTSRTMLSPFVNLEVDPSRIGWRPGGDISESEWPLKAPARRRRRSLPALRTG